MGLADPAFDKTNAINSLILTGQVREILNLLFRMTVAVYSLTLGIKPLAVPSTEEVLAKQPWTRMAAFRAG